MLRGREFVVAVLFGIAPASRLHLDHNQPFSCDTTLDQRDQIRAQVLAEVEQYGFTLANPNSDISYTQGEDGLGRPSRDLVFHVNPEDRHDMVYQMHSAKDVLVWIGCTPPRGAWYFGCTQYLNTLGSSVLDLWNAPLASMGDSLNQLTMRSTGEDFWESTFVMITAADRESARVVQAALEQHAPSLSSAINIQVIPSQIRSDLSLEVGRNGAKFSTGCRLSPRSASDWDSGVRDAAIAYMAHTEPLLVLDGSQSQLAPQPFATPPLRNRASGVTEVYLQGAFEQLVCRIQQRAFDLGFVPTRRNGQSSFVPLTPWGGDFYLNGTRCILEGGNCYQDSPDALYMKGDIGAARMQVVVGVNHRVAGTASYGYVTVGNSFSVHDRQTEGSATPWAGDLPEAHLLTAIVMMQDEEACQGLPADIRSWCFNAGDDDVDYAERAYLNPYTSTGPDKDELMPTTVLRFRRRRLRDDERPVCSAPVRAP